MIRYDKVNTIKNEKDTNKPAEGMVLNTPVSKFTPKRYISEMLGDINSLLLENKKDEAIKLFRKYSLNNATLLRVINMGLNPNYPVASFLYDVPYLINNKEELKKYAPKSFNASLDISKKAPRLDLIIKDVYNILKCPTPTSEWKRNTIIANYCDRILSVATEEAIVVERCRKRDFNVDYPLITKAFVLECIGNIFRLKF